MFSFCGQEVTHFAHTPNSKCRRVMLKFWKSTLVLPGNHGSVKLQHSIVLLKCCQWGLGMSGTNHFVRHQMALGKHPPGYIWTYSVVHRPPTTTARESYRAQVVESTVDLYVGEAAGQIHISRYCFLTQCYLQAFPYQSNYRVSKIKTTKIKPDACE